MSCISGVLCILLITHVSESEKTFHSCWAQLELRKLRFQNLKERVGIGHLLQLKKYLLQIQVKRHKWTWILQWHS